MSETTHGIYVRKELTPLSPVELQKENLFPSLAEAYAAVLDETSSDQDFGAAWKLGGTTPTTRAAFSVEKLYFGPLHKSEVLTAPTKAPGFKLFELKGEAEIGLRIAEKAQSLLQKKDKQAILNCPLEELFDAWCVTLELPSSPITNLSACGVNALIADRCAPGAIVLSQAKPISNDVLQAWQTSSLKIVMNGQAIANGDVAVLVDTPQDCARKFIVEALENGFAPAAGQWISTGGITPCVPLELGAKVQVHLNELVVIEFEVGDGAK
nr:hypothetical protein [uncultured Cohaesibacter sp.]